jgi:hypothetical protein
MHNRVATFAGIAMRDECLEIRRNAAGDFFAAFGGLEERLQEQSVIDKLVQCLSMPRSAPASIVGVMFIWVSDSMVRASWSRHTRSEGSDLQVSAVLSLKRALTLDVAPGQVLLAGNDGWALVTRGEDDATAITCGSGRNRIRMDVSDCALRQVNRFNFELSCHFDDVPPIRVPVPVSAVRAGYFEFVRNMCFA